MAERHPSGKVLHFLYGIFDNACQLQQTSKKYNILTNKKWLIDKFHTVNHCASCPGTSIDSEPHLRKVINSSTPEQNNSWCGRFTYVAI